MYLQQLECVVEVAKTGSLTAAAQSLHITLSAVSQSISSLEAELEVILFTRSRVGSIPTPEGQPIIKKALEIISKIEELKMEASDYTHTQFGNLKLATIPGPLSLAVEAILDFKKDYPGISLEIIEEGTAEILDDIRHNRVDLGLTVLNEDQIDEFKTLSFEKLLATKLVVAVNRQSPLSLYRVINPAELKGCPLVLYKDETVKAYMDDFQTLYGPFNTLFSTNNTEAIRTAVCDGSAATVGLDFSFISFSSRARGELVTIPLQVPDQKPFYLGLLRAQDKPFSNASRLFISRLKHELETRRNGLTVL